MGVMKIFADYTKIYYPIESPGTPQLLQNDVGRSETWPHIWKMLYNNKKCHHVHIGENSDISNYEMGSGKNKTQIERVKSEKDLGVIIDEKLKFHEHITQKVNKANRTLGLYLDIYLIWTRIYFLNFTSLSLIHLLNTQHKFGLRSTKKDKIMLENV